MTSENIDSLLFSVGLSRSTLAQKSNTSKSTVDSWFSNNSFPSWIESWLNLYQDNVVLRQSITSKDIAITELSKLISSSQTFLSPSIIQLPESNNNDKLLICKYEYKSDIDSIDDVYKVEITKRSGSRTYCRWLYNGDTGSLSSIAAEIQKIRNPSNQNPSINGNDYFVNSDGDLFAEIKEGK